MRGLGGQGRPPHSRDFLPEHEWDGRPCPSNPIEGLPAGRDVFPPIGIRRTRHGPAQTFAAIVTGRIKLGCLQISMLNALIEWSLANRFLVLVGTFLVAALGVYSATQPADRRRARPDERAGPGDHRGPGAQRPRGRDVALVPGRGGDERPARRRADPLDLQVRHLGGDDHLPRGDGHLPRPPARRRAARARRRGDPGGLRHADARADRDGARGDLPVPGQGLARVGRLGDGAEDDPRLVHRLPVARGPGGDRDQLARRGAEDVPGRAQTPTSWRRTGSR